MIYAGKTGIDLTGVDFSTTAIEEAKKNYPQGKYYVAEVTKTPFLDNTFDTVVILGVLDYFSPWDSVLDEARRICKPDGWILATLLHGFQGHDWKQYKHLTGNWYLFYESSNNRDGLGRTGDAQDIPGRSPV